MAWMHAPLHSLLSAVRQAPRPLPGSTAPILSHARLVAVQGWCIFCFAQMMQFLAHRTLAKLGSPKSEDAADYYKMPRTRGMFALVACPHYLAEIMTYIGLVLLSGRWPMSWLVLAWVVVNLALAANATHSW